MAFDPGLNQSGLRCVIPISIDVWKLQAEVGLMLPFVIHLCTRMRYYAIYKSY